VAVPAVLAALAGGLVVAVAVLVFPHLSHNHDEAVYLQQAALLLDGGFQYHAGPIADAVRPWFFVQDGGRLYPKYAPVPAGLFAVGMALGVPRLSLGLIAAGNAALVYALARAAFDRRTAILAVVFLLASPLFLFTSAAFLPYAPTTFLNLAFAFAYVRAARRSSVRWAAVAGAAVGLAFFARPYTALLFALPFVVHAGWSLVAARGDSTALRSVGSRQITTAAVGLVGVALTLAYNWRITGDPLLFPYEAFAPLDGLGFGQRKLLGHELRYTPELAIRSTGHLLWYLLTRWTAAGVLGTVAALAGIAATVRSLRQHAWEPSPTGLDARTLRVLFLGVLGSVVLGNVYFWGTVNVLGDPTDPTDGLMAFLGPFYHFDLLLPLSAFGAAGTLAVVRWLRDRARNAESVSPRQARAVLLAILLLATPVALAAEASVLGPAVDRNLAYTERYDRAYEPVEDRRPENAVVFAPTTYGEWLAHPFQRFRNDPGLDGRIVYALDRGGENLAVVDAYPNRTYYRYTYRGEWLAGSGPGLSPALQRLDVRRAPRLDATTTVGVPADTIAVVVRLSNGETTARYRLANASLDRSRLALDWRLTPDGVRLGNASGAVDRVAGPEVVPVDGTETVAFSITLHAERGPTLTYRQETSIRTTDDRVAVLWPPHRTVCTLVRDCGYEGTYLPGRPALYPDGVKFRTNLSAASTASGVSAVPAVERRKRIEAAG
jgi:4-amino-4-deoxy-L-arabinose transferase-like glycosyltransferase